MSWLSKLKDWWTKNIIHHGESDDISDRTGLSESDMSGDLSDEQWSRYLNETRDSPLSRYVGSNEAFTEAYRDKDFTNLYKGAGRNYLRALSLIFGIRGLGSLGSSETPSSDNDDLLRSLYGDAYTPSSGTGNNSIWNGIKSLFNGSSESFNLSGLGSWLSGISTELGSSILNYQNQVKLIDKQNEYNTPVNQMQRFADAGLNPNLVYGLGNNGNQPASGSIAPVDFSTASREARMQTLNYKMDLATRQAQINLLNNQSEETSERASAQRMANSVYMSQWLQEQQKRDEEINLLLAQARKAHSEADTIDEKRQWEVKIAEYESERAKHDRDTARIISEWADTRQMTGAIGDLFHFGFGLNGSFSRSRSTSTTVKPN